MKRVRGQETIIEGFGVEKRPVGTPRCRWENSIKLDLKDVGRGGIEWIYLDQDRGIVFHKMREIT
jgi:hypothetical protein